MNKEEELLFQIGKKLIKLIDRIVSSIRRQDYFKALKIITPFTTELSNYIDSLFNQIENLSKKEFICSTDYIVSMLEGILAAQQSQDYILFADLIEFQLQPFLVELQTILVKEIDIIEDKKGMYEIEPTSSGDWTIAVKKEETFYLHTNGLVWKEARILAEQWYQIEKDTYYVYGLGLGYHIQALLELDQSIRVVVLEGNIEMIELCKKYGLFYTLEQNKRVEIIIDETYRMLSKYLNELNKNSKFVIHYPSIRAICQMEIREQLEEYFMQINTIESQLNRLIRNFYSNIKNKNKYAQILLEELRGKDIYLIAAGPSLDNNIEQLKKINREKSIILSVGTVLKKLMKAGIYPDYGIITDGNANVYEQIRNLEKEIPLILLSTVHESVLKCYKGNTYLLFQYEFELAEKFAEENNLFLVKTGGSVTTTALDFCIQMECNKIILVGADMAYTGYQDHAKGVSFNQTMEKQRFIMVEGIIEKEVPSTRNLNIYRKWIERYVKEYQGKIKIINATEGGARIHGMIEEKLEDVICLETK